MTENPRLSQHFSDADKEKIKLEAEKNMPKILGYLINKSENLELSEDLAQDTYIKIHTALEQGKYKEKNKLLPWMFRMAHNCLMDEYRRRKRKITIQSYDNFLPGSNDTSFVDSIEDKDLMPDEKLQQLDPEELWLAVKQLPPEQQEVLKKRIISDMPFLDIAEEQEISINTALGRQRYALRNLRKMSAIQTIISRYDI